MRKQQSDAERSLHQSEEDIERCTKVAADEASRLTEAQLEVERLRRCLQAHR